MYICIHFLEAHSSKVTLIPRQPTKEENSIFLLGRTTYKITQEILQDRTRIIQFADKTSTRLVKMSFRWENMGVG